MDNDYLTPVVIDKQVVKRGEGWGAMDNDYLTPVLVNKQVVKRGEGWGTMDNGPQQLREFTLLSDELRSEVADLRPQPTDGRHSDG